MQETLGTGIEEAVGGSSTQDELCLLHDLAETARALPRDKAHCKQIIFMGLISSVRLIN